MNTICKFKKGDRLQLLTGKNRKAVGNLKKIIVKKKQVLIEGVNIVIKHQKADPNRNIAGGRQKMEAPVHISNVALVCPKCLLPTRVGYQILPKAEDSQKQRKVRICRRCKAQIDD
jgi:large subunit ribosomal protein L24